MRLKRERIGRRLNKKEGERECDEWDNEDDLIDERNIVECISQISEKKENRFEKNICKYRYNKIVKTKNLN
jgi:hypothetical protein